jgi:hypothetical protein
MAEYEKKVRELLKRNGFVFYLHGKGDHGVRKTGNPGDPCRGSLKTTLTRDRTGFTGFSASSCKNTS